MNRSLRVLVVGVVALVILIGILAMNRRAERASIDLGDRFVRGPSEILYAVNDAGVGDFDGDGRLDWWTTNHSALQSLFLQRDDGQFSANAIQDLGLAHNRDYPGLEAVLDADSDEQGTRVYAERTSIRIDVSENVPEAVSGFVEIPWDVRVTHSGGGSSGIVVAADGVERRIDFEIPPGADLSVTPVPPPSDGFPIAIEFDSAVDLASIRVGDGVVPSSHRIEFHPKDRHTFLLADVIGDERKDLFISRGGARGRLATAHPEAQDELFEATDQGYIEGIANAGFVKDSCPARQSAWVDVDSDGDLDLYQVCGRGKSDLGEAPNRLYVQVARGRFEERAAEFGLDFPDLGSFAWVFSEDGSPELIWMTSDAIEFHRRRDGRFTQVWREDRAGSATDRLVIGDPDMDGHVEIVVVSPSGNRWIDLEGGDLVSSAPAADRGLPNASVDGGFVDVDLDGNLEFYALPQGLSALGEDGQYELTGGLAYHARHTPRTARSSWFDADGDGDLDLWFVASDPELAPSFLRKLHGRLPSSASKVLEEVAHFLFGPMRWHDRTFELVRIENRASGGGWLQVDLEGAPGNREAIGAEVRVRVGDRWQNAWVGQSDGSRFSQAHYRLYFGLGDAEQVDEIVVRFADGTEMRRDGGIAAGQRLTLQHPRVAPANP